MKSYGLEMIGDLQIEDSAKLRTNKLWNKDGTEEWNFSNSLLKFNEISLNFQIYANDFSESNPFDNIENDILLMDITISTSEETDLYSLNIKDDTKEYYKILGIEGSFYDNFLFFVPNKENNIKLKIENYKSETLNCTISIKYIMVL